MQLNIFPNEQQFRFGKDIANETLSFHQFNATDSLAIVGFEGTESKKEGSTCFVCSLGVILLDLTCFDSLTEDPITNTTPPSNTPDDPQGVFVDVQTVIELE